MISQTGCQIIFWPGDGWVVGVKGEGYMCVWDLNAIFFLKNCLILERFYWQIIRLQNWSNTEFDIVDSQQISPELRTYKVLQPRSYPPPLIPPPPSPYRIGLGDPVVSVLGYSVCCHRFDPE